MATISDYDAFKDEEDVVIFTRLETTVFHPEENILTIEGNNSETGDEVYVLLEPIDELDMDGGYVDEERHDEIPVKFQALVTDDAMDL